jgi:hypothetical protein
MMNSRRRQARDEAVYSTRMDGRTRAVAMINAAAPGAGFEVLDAPEQQDVTRITDMVCALGNRLITDAHSHNWEVVTLDFTVMRGIDRRQLEGSAHAASEQAPR